MITKKCIKYYLHKFSHWRRPPFPIAASTIWGYLFSPRYEGQYSRPKPRWKSMWMFFKFTNIYPNHCTSIGNSAISINERMNTYKEKEEERTIIIVDFLQNLFHRYLHLCLAAGNRCQCALCGQRTIAQYNLPEAAISRYHRF
jgi:hypothetical protein